MSVPVTIAVVVFLVLAATAAIVTVLSARKYAYTYTYTSSVPVSLPVAHAQTHSSSSSHLERTEALDQNRNFVLTSRPDFDRKSITFEITARTRGFVGFGLSQNGGMNGADIFIGGVHDDGGLYGSDRHGTGDWEPVMDRSQDWTLVAGSENATHTTLVVQRLFNTCDEDGDVEIDNSTLSLIWAFGSDDSDQVQYHGAATANRGAYMVNLLDPLVVPPSTMTGNGDAVMPAVSTFYGCTIHKAPKLEQKHHIVGYETILSSSVAQKHIHHWMVRQCVASAGAISLEPQLEQWIGREPQDCFSFEEYQLCSANRITCGISGKPIVFPPEAGLAFGGTEGAEPSYYLLEVHYNNPELLKGTRFEAGVDVYYTTELRRYDVGSLIIGYAIDVRQIIPPKASSFVTSVQCNPNCLEQMVPPGNGNTGGALVFNILLHAHLAARKMKIRHFRNGTELPWLDHNELYHFNYQQSRPLRKPVNIQQTDQFTLECTYETMDRVNATYGGPSTAHEMCEAYLLNYPAVKGAASGSCTSSVPRQKVLEYFGVEDVDGNLRDPLVTSPSRLAGQRFIDVVNRESKWTAEMRADWPCRSEPYQRPSSCTPPINISAPFMPPF